MEKEMTWNLRLVNMTSHEYPDEDYIEIREVFYDQMGKPLGHSAAAMGGQDKDEIKQYLKWAMEALDKSVLTFGE
jgi:hypothetical protein